MRKERSVTLYLYDLRERNYPNKRDDIFRSLQVFECPICGAVTNRVIMGGWPGYGVRTVCPNSSECWHHDLEEMMGWSGMPHPFRYRRELEKEIHILLLTVKQTHLVKNDIKGEPNFTLKRRVTNTRSFRKDSVKKGTCNHF